MNTKDPLFLMFEELRAQIPPAPGFTDNSRARVTWLNSLTPIIQAMAPEQQWACTTLLCHDIVTLRYPGMPIGMCYTWLAREFALNDEVDHA